LDNVRVGGAGRGYHKFSGKEQPERGGRSDVAPTLSDTLKSQMEGEGDTEVRFPAVTLYRAASTGLSWRQSTVYLWPKGCGGATEDANGGRRSVNSTPGPEAVSMDVPEKEAERELQEPFSQGKESEGPCSLPTPLR
ncbi:hypothetical protein M514_07812, partial [Trichuris suis]